MSFMICTPGWRRIPRLSCIATQVSYRTLRVAAQPFVELKLSGDSAGEMDIRIGLVLLLSTKRSRTIALSCGYCFHSVVMFSGQVERRQWWLWASTIVVTLLLTA